MSTFFEPNKARLVTRKYLSIMKIKHLTLSLAIIATSAMLTNCTGNSNNDLKEVNLENDTTDVLVSGEAISDMIQNISSPVEMANQIKNTGIGFSQNILNSPGAESKYETSFKRAVNLGVYSADLGYINTFNKNLVVVDYLSSVKRLADGIGVGQFLDITTLSRLAKNSTNLDSLKQLSVTSFNEMDRYLRDKNRSNVSPAIIVGTWVEGMHITSSVIQQTKNEDLINRLGETKNIVDILQIVVNTYSRSDKDYANLAKKFNALKQAYSDVRITTELGEPVTKEVDGMLVIEQNEITHVQITPEQVDDIISKLEDIRAFIVE